MKNIFIKIFLFICGVVAIFESALFFMVGLRRLSIKGVISLYNFVMRTPEALNAALGLAAGFLCLGLILFTAMLHNKRPQRSIVIRDKDGMLRIPIETIEDFINQLLSQNPNVRDFDTTVRHKGRWVYVDISSAFNSTIPVCQEVSQMRRVLKEKLSHTFEFSHSKINFQMNSVGNNSRKEEADLTEKETDTATQDEDVSAKEAYKKRARAIFSR